MLKLRSWAVVPALALAVLAACGGDEEATEDEGTTTEQIVTEPTTEQVEVTVPSVDSAAVRTTVDVDTNVSRTVDETPPQEGTDPDGDDDN